MEQRKPKILITNDDGVHARGIWHLWHALAEFAEVCIIAPSTERSGVGSGITLHHPLTIEPVKWETGTRVWKINGTPADCIRMGMSVILENPPDLVVSGINHGSNAGRSVLYSGTIGGVVESALRRIPGIAFSSEAFEDDKYWQLERFICPIVSHILQHPLSEGTLLNVNFPAQPDTIRGVRLARQGRSLWVEDPTERVHPDGNPYYWHGGRWADHPEQDDSDVALLKQGYITAVPIHIDQLTDHKFLAERKQGFETLL
jgi:5'-nucleotidase